jgi:hypothetical protein
MQTTQLNREELEAKALESVCACWVDDLEDYMDFIDDAHLEAIVADGTVCHYENQKYNSSSEEEFKEELRQCPDYKGAAV